MDSKRYYIVVDGLCCEEGRRYMSMLMRCNPGVLSVKINNFVACIETTRTPNKADWVRQINEGGLLYTRESLISERNPVRVRWFELLLIAAMLIAVYVACDRLLGYDLASAMPSIDSSMTLGAVFVTGLFCSIHCVCMCGAINLTTVFGEAGNRDEPGYRDYRPALLFNVGRLISYTAVGFAVGALGSVIQVSHAFSGAIVLLASLAMVLMALNMAGLVSIPIFRCVAHRAKAGRGAFAVGLLNALMPCGALQAMELYALTTGSPLTGALSMFLFCLGTVPLMFGLGTLASAAGGVWRIRATKVASVLLLMLALVMAGRGMTALGLGGLGATDALAGYSGYARPEVVDGVQYVETKLEPHSFGDVVVYAGIPVRLTIHAAPGTINGCNKALHIDGLGVNDVELAEGDTVIEFTPEKTGEYVCACWMDMIANTVAVVDGERG